jgi:predicted small lipoprotein YifL
MRVTQYARFSLSATLLLLGLAACGKDNGPSEFDPQGTTADVAEAQDAFVSAQASSFAAIGTDISTVLNGAPVVASSAALASPRPSAASAQYARQLVSLLPGAGPRIQASVSAIPSAALGATFVWDEQTHAYAASDLSGAPSNGVRFLLYAIDPVSLRPVEPVVQVGYVDVTDESTAATVAYRVKVVDGSVVYLDYGVSASGAESSGIVTVSGFASNGSARANFTLNNTISQNSSGGLLLSLDYRLSVPSRKVSLDWTATIANISPTEGAVTLDLAISGPNGSVRIVGTYGATGGGNFTVKVNGDLFATISFEGSSAVITGANGASLTADEEETLHTILDYYDQSLGAFDDLVAPLRLS